MKRNNDKLGLHALVISAILFLGVFVCSVFVSSPALAQTTPTIITIDAPGAGTQVPPIGSPHPEGTFATAINDTGWIAGYYVDGNVACHGFVRSPDGSFSSFDSPPTPSPRIVPTCPQPTSINASGVVTGFYQDPSFGCTAWPDTAGGCGGNHGFLRMPDGTFITFDAPPQLSNPTGAFGGNTNPGTFALSINSAGQIAGFYMTSGQGASQSSFLRQPDGTFISFDPPNANVLVNPGAHYINASGAIVGSYIDTATSVTHGFLRAPDGTFLTIDAPGANTRASFGGTAGVSINSQGEIAGNFTDMNGITHDYVRAANGTFTVFDVSGANDIPGASNGPFVDDSNDNGTVVGHFADSSNHLHGFVRAADGTITTFDAPGPITSAIPNEGVAINSAGAIVGTYGDANGVDHGFLRSAKAIVVNSFSPNSGTAGTAITVLGSGFTGATGVAFNVAAASFTVVSDTQITTSVPTGATTGPIAVLNAGNEGISSANFTVTPSAVPTVSGFSPASGPLGTLVTITGTNFTGTTAVTFNGTNTTSFQVSSDTQLTAVVPSGATTGPIAVTNAVGAGHSANNFTVSSTAAPVVSGFSPTSGLPNTPVTITGNHFSGTSNVTFNGQAANFTVNSDAQITASVPSGATTGPISITTPQGTGSSFANFTVTTGPGISSFSPTSGRAGTTVTINGVGLSGTTNVSLNGITGVPSASFTIISDSQVTATVPSGATTGPINIISSSKSLSSSANFTVLSSAPPTISSFSPTSGPQGTLITVSGSNFTGATAVTLNSIALGFVVASDTQLSARVPHSGATSGAITVTNAAGSATSAANFIMNPSAITSFSPTSGPVGAKVTITGSGFTGTTGVEFNRTAAGFFTVVSDTQLTAVVPSRATSGPITVTNTAGRATSSVSFIVGRRRRRPVRSR